MKRLKPSICTCVRQCQSTSDDHTQSKMTSLDSLLDPDVPLAAAHTAAAESTPQANKHMHESMLVRL